MTTETGAPTPSFDTEARRVPALNGARWLAGGWHLLRQAWWQWPLLVLLALMVHGLILNLPVASGLLTMLLMPVLGAGFGAFAQGVERGDRRLSLLFDGFRKRPGSLALAGLITFLWLLAGVVITALVALFVVGQETLDVISMSQSALDGQQLLIIIGLSALLLGLTTPATLAFWFAPLLIHANDTGAIAGLKASLRGTLRNWRALLVNGVILSLVLFVLVISVAVGTAVATFITPTTLLFTLPLLGVLWLLLATWIGTTWLAAFRDLYGRQPDNQTE